MTEYIVVIKQGDEVAKLECESVEEAKKVYNSFVNYGKYDSLDIENKLDIESF